MGTLRIQLPLDYSRCGNKSCPRQEDCARFKDIPIFAPWLAYSMFGTKGDCEHFIQYLDPNGEGNETQPL